MHTALPIGVVRPSGWMRAQLELEANGLTGHLMDFYPDVQNSSWLGGSHDVGPSAGERFSYWFNGVVPLAHQLGDDRLIRIVNDSLTNILSRIGPSGWLGPEPVIESDTRSFWGRYRMLSALASHYEATGDERLPSAMVAHLKEQSSRMWKYGGLGSLWSAGRVHDLVATVAWLIERGGDAGLQAAPFLHLFAFQLYNSRGVYDWEGWFQGPAFPKSAVGAPGTLGALRSFYHGVDAGEALKSGAVWWRFLGDESLLASSGSRVNKIEASHGFPTGEICADEHLCGSMPSMGTELCVIVEQMASYGTIGAATGNAVWYERLERLLLNALPASYTKDMWHHPYLHQSNEISAVPHAEPVVWISDGPNATIYGVDGGGAGCCTTNGGMGFPVALASALRATIDGGLSLGVFVPLNATFPLSLLGVAFSVDSLGRAVYPHGGATENLTVTVSTSYPFEDIVRISVAGVPLDAKIPFYIRVPSWVSSEAQVNVTNGSSHTISYNVSSFAGGFFQVSLSSGNTLISFDTSPRIIFTTGWHNNSASVSRGALVYTLLLNETVAVAHQYPFPQAQDLNVTTPSPWNFAILRTGLNFSSTGAPPGSLPFSGGSSNPLRITAWGRRLPSWGILKGSADAPPLSPVCAKPEDICGDPEIITLVPHGTTLLRITEFPWVA